MHHALVLILALLVVPAFGQPAPVPDSAMLQKALDVVADQRNQALNAHASILAYARTLEEENKKLKEQIEQLKKKD